MKMTFTSALFGSSRNKVYLVLCVIALLVFPAFVSSYVTHLMIFILLYTYLGCSWDILGGYCGQTSFGHASFFGLGAYTSTVLLMKINLSPWIGMLIGGLVGLAFGLFMGYLCFRYNIKASYFALTMLSVSEILRLIFLNWDFVGGASGLLIPIRERGALFFQFSDKIYYYYVIAIMACLVLLLNHTLLKSKFGDFLVAIRENEESAEAMGVDVLKYKLLAIAMSSFLTALGGTFYASYLTYIEPNITFGIPLSIEILLRPLMGGSGTLFGPAIGAVFLGPLGEISRLLMHGYSGVHLMLYGLLIIIVILFLPGGIVGVIKRAKVEGA